jgi:hypothetical protein
MASVGIGIDAEIESGSKRKIGLERIFGNVDCSFCHNLAPCEWFHIEKLREAAPDTKLKQGYWICYKCYTKCMPKDLPYGLETILVYK